MKFSPIRLALFASLFLFSILLMTSPEARAGEICFCHLQSSTPHTICTSNTALQNAHRVNHGDSPFGCECGDGICDAGLGETCGTCPQDCGECSACGDGRAGDGEECGDGGLTCAGVTGCGIDGSGCVCDGCRCAPKCVDDGVCNASEDCTSCADCTPCDVCGNGALEPGEDCDDGNASAGDCCGADCRLEPEGSACFDGDSCTSPDSCDASGVCAAGPAIDCTECADANGNGICDEDEGTLSGEGDDTGSTPPPASGSSLGFAGGFCSLIRDDR